MRDPAELEIAGSDEREHNDKTYRVIFGKPKDGDGSVEQVYRYPKMLGVKMQHTAFLGTINQLRGGAYPDKHGDLETSTCDFSRFRTTSNIR